MFAALVVLIMSTHICTEYFEDKLPASRAAWHDQLTYSCCLFVWTTCRPGQIWCGYKALQVLRPLCRDISISLSTDGKEKMISRISGTVEMFHNTTKPCFIWILCGVHQIEFSSRICTANWQTWHSTRSPSHWSQIVRRQQRRICDIRTYAPKVLDTRWESIDDVSRWFKTNCIAIVEYLGRKKAA